MSLLLRKYFWAFNLLTIAICAGFAASALGKLVETKLPRPPVRRVAAPPPALGQAMAGNTQRDITQILSRNLFCSTCEKVSETPLAGEASAESTEPQSNEPVKTSLNLTLVATLVDPEDVHSYAVIQDNAAMSEGSGSGGGPGAAPSSAPARPAVGIVGTNETVPGDSKATVTFVDERRVYILNAGRAEYLSLLDEGTAQPQTLNPQPSGEPLSYTGHRMPSAQSGLDDVAKGIQKVGEGKYEIQRSALNKVLGNTTMLARSARIVPSSRNGQPDGFKLYAIRPGSLYSLLGMFNGDTINAINGHSITTPDKALEVYTKLRSASHVSINFTRRGTAVTHEYTIR